VRSGFGSVQQTTPRCGGDLISKIGLMFLIPPAPVIAGDGCCHSLFTAPNHYFESSLVLSVLRYRADLMMHSKGRILNPQTP
jgi:hypothetical protein